MLEAEPGQVEFQPSPFFAEQLHAFELWLEHGSQHKRPPEQLPIVLQVCDRADCPPILYARPRPRPRLRLSIDCSHCTAGCTAAPGAYRCVCDECCRSPTAALVQVLLSQVHRMRALKLLGRFLDMGSWAVDLALSVGIFPYVLKLLQTTAADLRSTLVFIWTKILALDKSCQVRARLLRKHAGPLHGSEPPD